LTRTGTGRRVIGNRIFRTARLFQINSSFVARDRFAFAGNSAEVPARQNKKENKGGSHDKCCASFSLCRRVVLSLVRRDRAGLFCRQVAIWLLREALNEPWIKFTSNAMRLSELMGLMDEIPRMFEIVEPKRAAVS
jgi:hypothetical protein